MLCNMLYCIYCPQVSGYICSDSAEPVFNRLASSAQCFLEYIHQLRKQYALYKWLFFTFVLKTLKAIMHSAADNTQDNLPGRCWTCTRFKKPSQSLYSTLCGWDEDQCTEYRVSSMLLHSF